jgi:hypothetical protein
MLAAVAYSAVVHHPKFSWDTVPHAVQCHNFTGALNSEILAVMKTAGIVTIDIQQAQFVAPGNASAETKMGDALKQVRAINPDAAILFYETVDAARDYSDLGKYFQSDPSLTLPSTTGAPTLKYNWTNLMAVGAWASHIAGSVKTFGFDGVFIDGYQIDCRPGGRTYKCQTSRGAKVDNLSAYINGYWNRTGPALAAALPSGALMIPNCENKQACQDGNGRTAIPGYNALMEEFFDGTNLRPASSSDENLASLAQLGAHETIADINLTDEKDQDHALAGLAAFLIGAGVNQFYSAIGWYWQCSEVPTKTLLGVYDKPLGAPKGPASNTTTTPAPNVTNVAFRREFGAGTIVLYNVTASTDSRGRVTNTQHCCISWSDGSTAACNPGECGVLSS